MTRLRGFDYKKPYFYMVTLKKRPGIAAFSQIGAPSSAAVARPLPGVAHPSPAAARPLPVAARHSTAVARPPECLVYNEITKAFSQVIRHFHEAWRDIWPIECFMVMPDHIHLLIRLKKCENQMPLSSYVYQLMKALGAAYRQATQPVGSPGWQTGSPGWQTGSPGGQMARAPKCEPLPMPFERDWHDWIVMRNGQLESITRYIRENAKRAWVRQCNRRYFGRVREVSFLGYDWYAYGNCALLELPGLVPIKGHRATKRDDKEWKELVAAARRIGPGCAGVSTFMSPLEKECGNAIAKAGGKWIVLCPEGFGERWHPPRAKERFCAEGRMLFLSRWVENRNGRPSNAELYRRCHVMGDLVAAALAPGGEPPRAKGEPVGRAGSPGGR